MLCLQSLSSLAATLGVLSENPGEDFEVVSVSIDPRETPALALEKKAHYVERSGKPSIAQGWHYLTGTEANIQRLTKAAGFRYAWDESQQQFAHPAGIVIATPQGKVARYLFGIDYGPRDLRLALARCIRGENQLAAQEERCSTATTTTWPLAATAWRLCASCSVAGAATVLSLGTLIFVWTRRERRQVG